MLKLSITPVYMPDKLPGKFTEILETLLSHMRSVEPNCHSLTDYAIQLHRIVEGTSIDGPLVFKYLDGIIEIYNGVINDGEDPIYPFMTITY